MESTVRSVTSLEWSTGNTKFEAWPVDPPGSGSGPLSSWTMSRHPSSARWLTAALPTTPAPMTTMSARSGICAMAYSRTAAGTLVIYQGEGGVMGGGGSWGHSAELTEMTVLVAAGTPVRSLSGLAYY